MHRVTRRTTSQNSNGSNKLLFAGELLLTLGATDAQHHLSMAQHNRGN